MSPVCQVEVSDKDGLDIYERDLQRIEVLTEALTDGRRALDRPTQL